MTSAPRPILVKNPKLKKQLILAHLKNVRPKLPGEGQTSLWFLYGFTVHARTHLAVLKFNDHHGDVVVTHFAVASGLPDHVGERLLGIVAVENF